jgi:hypothetical protein
LGKIVKAPISATKALFTKWLMGLWIIAAWTWTLAYTNDWDLHWDTLAVALAAYILVDDVWQIRTSLVNKIPYGGEIANVIGKWKNMLPDWAQNLWWLWIILGTGYLYETTARPKIVK